MMTLVNSSSVVDKSFAATFTHDPYVKSIINDYIKKGYGIGMRKI